jgi:hypothetical protein
MTAKLAAVIFEYSPSKLASDLANGFIKALHELIKHIRYAY